MHQCVKLHGIRSITGENASINILKCVLTLIDQRVQKHKHAMCYMKMQIYINGRIRKESGVNIQKLG